MFKTLPFCLINEDFIIIRRPISCCKVPDSVFSPQKISAFLKMLKPFLQCWIISCLLLILTLKKKHNMSKEWKKKNLRKRKHVSCISMQIQLRCHMCESRDQKSQISVLVFAACAWGTVNNTKYCTQSGKAKKQKTFQLMNWDNLIQCQWILI